jgi:carbonic anhydrase/acetyltransferase-like protein (isoleucine patch superfamily)
VRVFPVSVEIAALLLAGCVRAAPVHGPLRENVVTDFNPIAVRPEVSPSTFVDPDASVIGAVRLGSRVFVAPFASIRGDEGHPIAIGDESNVQDGVVIHALETEVSGQPVLANTVEQDGHRYAVWIGSRVSLAHQAQIHGPALVGDDTFVGMQSLIFRARIGRHCVLEPRALVTGVSVPDGRYVPAGAVVRSQADADALPSITDTYPLRAINEAVVHVNSALAVAYAAKARAAGSGAP